MSDPVPHFCALFSNAIEARDLRQTPTACICITLLLHDARAQVPSAQQCFTFSLVVVLARVQVVSEQ